MLKKRYEGFLKTPCLWVNNSIFNIEQFEISSKYDKIEISLDENLRLGKYVERLVSFELEQQNDISVLAENIQIQDGKITLGELDCLLLKNDKPVHLEIIYKFYLYDESVGDSEINHFIGPNRKDSLLEKLNKLKDKQLPLLYSDVCKPYLDTLDINIEVIKQQVYFKAQLFLPFSNQDIKLNTLNTDCIAGFYINLNALQQFEDCKFYIPNKKDWLVIPHANVNWLNFNTFELKTKNFLEQKFSALCWIKFKNGELKKLFLVWW
ncbi:DUF1853 domain-containing protein [Algibacter marinivivus]|uniref:DUF1853 domain-containing protein n=1 Tax=Algibacter marinivivus TaxID=2100723 RepID=A0A2U2X749_9FLAO|nr:DUF1853 family protein [Algibacter marinivivus]PWH83582.1 DUF1853 domain-containing protein [Algibacter marinivivus]